jgi:hypothetical protein
MLVIFVAVLVEASHVTSLHNVDRRRVIDERSLEGHKVVVVRVERSTAVLT